MDSQAPGRGSGVRGGVFAGDVVEAICSLVWDIDDQGSFHLTDDVERRTLGRNARVRETKWYRKIDMVLLG
jgi:hypothetical protein